MNLKNMGDHAILYELGERLRRERLNQNITQVVLARHAGLSRKVVQNLENGAGCTLGAFIKILRTLGKLEAVDAFLPDPGISPIQLARLKGFVRQRASGQHYLNYKKG